MERIESDRIREERIHEEAIVDAHGAEEQAMGWYYYLEDKISFPFKGKCITQRRTSPLEIDEEFDVLEMAPEEECEKEMFIDIIWDSRKLSVPLSQISGIDVDDETEEAISDWHYWIARGYQF